jgi:hypothetical protein
MKKIALYCFTLLCTPCLFAMPWLATRENKTPQLSTIENGTLKVADAESLKNALLAEEKGNCLELQTPILRVNAATTIANHLAGQSFTDLHNLFAAINAASAAVNEHRDPKDQISLTYGHQVAFLLCAPHKNDWQELAHEYFVNAGGPYYWKTTPPLA